MILAPFLVNTLMALERTAAMAKLSFPALSSNFAALIQMEGSEGRKVLALFNTALASS
jgi:hypothetical protein